MMRSRGVLFLVSALLLLGGCGGGPGGPIDPGSGPIDPGPGGNDPRGNRIAFLSSGNVASMKEDGSNRVMLTEDEIGPYDWASGPLNWSPDGTRLLTQLIRFQPGGIVDEAVVVAGDGSGYSEVAGVLYWGLQVGTWSPNGSRVSYVKALTSHFGSSAIFTANPDGTDEQLLVTGTPSAPPGAHDLAPAWSPDGADIAFLSDRHVPPAPEFQWHLFSAKIGESGAVLVSSAEVRGFDWAPDARRLITTQGEESSFNDAVFSNLYLLDRATGVSTRLSQQDNVDTGAIWSPDGTRLAFTSIRDGNIEMYVMNDDGSRVQRLTNDPAEDWVGAWSPDGARLAFQTNRDGNWEIYTINVDGTGLTNLTRNAAQETSPAWR
jgi:dipeptidyl aminopeptidase/acylaminoacyl peptidase